MSGWIKIHRKIQECDLWLDDDSEPFDRRSAWIDLLMLTYHHDTKKVSKNKVYSAKRGQYVTSVRKLATRWGWGKDKVLKYLRLLEQLGMITRVADSEKTVITIVNYDIYQCKDEDEQTPTRTQSRHATDTHPPLYKNDKNVKNEKNNTIRSVFFPDNETLDNEFREYVEHRKAIKKPFKTDHSVELAINNLMKLANGNSDKAVLIIQQSIRQGWQGLFELKQEKSVPQYKQFSHSKELTDLEKELLAN